VLSAFEVTIMPSQKLEIGGPVHSGRGSHATENHTPLTTTMAEDAAAFPAQAAEATTKTTSTTTTTTSNQQHQQRSKGQKMAKSLLRDGEEAAGTMTCTTWTTTTTTTTTATTNVVVVHQPGDNDVLLGRGKACINYVGNRRYRALIKPRKAEYKACTRTNRKELIAREIYEEITSRRGVRFLQERVPTTTPDHR
jgi:hypothetical protein